jgi:outer membrane protein OmpA-like peptidoglycan-associated protein
MRFKTTAGATVLLLGLAAPALAQMAPEPPAIFVNDMWRGLYAGVNIGGGFGNTTATNNNTGFTTNQKLNFGGVVGGIQGGYNYRIAPSWLVGLELDFGGTDFNANGTQTRTIGPATASATVSRSQEWLGTVRGRVGYNINPSLLWYVTGGFAYGEVNSSASASVSGATVPGLVGPQSASIAGSKSGVQTGWTIGTGTEYAIGPQLGVTFQYLYTDLGSFSYSPRITSATTAAAVSALRSNVTVDNNANIFRVGLNYHFGPPPLPPAPAAIPAPPAPSPRVFIVFFDWDRDTVTPDGVRIVQQAADVYKAGGAVQIHVTGYTDRSGSPGYNQRLSERRANNVAKVLVGFGISQNQLLVSGRGENDNRIPTADGVREPQNRRVEITS